MLIVIIILVSEIKFEWHAFVDFNEIIKLFKIFFGFVIDN